MRKEAVFMNQKRFFSIVRYQLHDFKKSAMIMYSCVYFLFIVSCIDHNTLPSDKHVTLNGMELVSMITLLVIGLVSFKENFNFFSINGISRRTQFFSTLFFFGILCAIFALIDTLNVAVFPHISNYTPLFLLLYQPAFQGFGPAAYFLMLVTNFLLLWVVYIFISMVGLFITTLYYRMNRGMKIAVSVGVPVILVNGINLLDAYLLHGKLMQWITQALCAVWGLSGGCHPFVAIGSHVLLACCFSALTFLLARKAVVKK